MKYDSFNLSEIIEKIENNEYILPNFQRGFVWDENKQKKLISSFIVKIPIGSTLNLEGKKNDFAARALCENREINFDKSDQTNCIYILDGQQRLSTLKNCFFNLYENKNWKKVFDALFSNLRLRWFLNIDNDFFGFNNLTFNKEKIESTEPQKLLDYIIAKKILKTKDTDKWYHPAFINLDSDSLNKFRQSASNEKLIPLYELYKGKNGIHRKVLGQIANTKMLDLQQKVENKELDIRDILTDINEDKRNQETQWIIHANNWVNDVSNYLESLLETKIPAVILPPKEMGRAAAIFEEINKGGLALSTYDLIVAKTAKNSDVLLTKKILDSFTETLELGKLSSNKNWKPECMMSGKDNELSKKFQDIFLNALAIIIYSKEGLKNLKKEHLYQSSILELDGQKIIDNLEKVLTAIKRTYAFLQFRLGIIKESNIRYVYMILPFIYLFTFDEIWYDEKRLNLLEAWYWSAFFSGEFRDTQDEKFIRNLKKLYIALELNKNQENIDIISDWIEWIDSNEKYRITFRKLKETILKNDGYSDIDTLLSSDFPKAMEDAILQYCLSRNPEDLRKENTIQLSAWNASCKSNDLEKNQKCKKYKLEIHHIIPLANSKNIGESSKELRKKKDCILNTPLNLTYISECANREISDFDAKKYLNELGDKITDHCLSIEKNMDNINNEKEFYKKLLEKRFEKIRDKLISELRDLTR